MVSTLLCPVVKINKYIHWSEKKNLPSQAMCEAMKGKERYYSEEFWSPLEARIG